jgi:alpha-beta hydrolase superfamily lysophospholipase
VINPFSKKYHPVFWTKEQFQFAFADHLNGSDLDNAYKNCVPQSKLVPRESLTNTAKINFSLKEKPLLMIAGEKDKIIPASLNETNFKKYKKADSVTEFKIFPERRHNLIVDSGWEEIAKYCDNWIRKIDEKK